MSCICRGTSTSRYRYGYGLDTCKSLKPLPSQLNFILHELFECQMQTFVKPDRRLANKRTNKRTFTNEWTMSWGGEYVGMCGCVGRWENGCMWGSWSSVLRSLHNLNVACTKLTIFVACQWIFRPHCHPLFRWASANLNKLAGLVGQTNFPRFPSPSLLWL